MASLFDQNLFLDALAEAVLAIDPMHRVVYINDAASKLLGYRADELEGRSLFELVPEGLPDVDPPASAQPMPAGERPVRQLRMSDGRTLDVECSVSHCLDEQDERLVVALLRPVSAPSARRSEQAVMRYLRVVAQETARLGMPPDAERVLRAAVATLVFDFDACLARFWLGDRGSSHFELRATEGLVLPNGHQGSVDDTVPPIVLSAINRGEPVVERCVEPADYDVVCRSADGRAMLDLVAMPLVIAGQRRGAFLMGVRGSLSEQTRQALVSLGAVVASSLNDICWLPQDQAARRVLEDEHRRVQSVIDGISAGVAIVEGPEGQITRMNPAGRSILGLVDDCDLTFESFDRRYQIEHLDGRPVQPQERPVWRAIVRGEHSEETLRYRTPAGPELTLHLTASPIPGASGGAIVTFRDISRQSQLEAELADRFEQVRAMLNRMPIGVTFFDAEGRCQACNGETLRVFGRQRHEVIDRSSEHLFDGHPALAAAMRSCIQERTPQRVPDYPCALPGQPIRFLDWRFTPLTRQPSGGFLGVLVVTLDLTDNKRAADALQEAKEAAEDAASNKTRFLSAISHDIRTPVNNVNLVAEYLRRFVDGDQADPDLARLVHELGRASSTLVELVKDLLDLTNFDSGGMAQNPSTFEVDEWLDTYLQPMAFGARERGLKFHWRSRPINARVTADRVKLGRIVANLAGNALKFTSVGEVGVEVEVRPDGRLLIEVADTGSGIPQDQLERIFDEFAQLRNPARDRSKGTGLGLAICKRLVDAVHGRILVRSRVGRGSTFSVEYPVEVAPPAPHRLSTSVLAARPNTPPDAESPSSDDLDAEGPSDDTNPHLVLLVEDDPSTRIPMTALLESEGYEVATATEGTEALEKIAQLRPALVLLDLMMPGMDGAEVLARIRGNAQWKDLAVVILSGDILEERLEKLRLLGVSGTLAKPVDLHELFRIVGRHARPATSASEAMPGSWP